jgi:hypothetical protein
LLFPLPGSHAQRHPRPHPPPPSLCQPSP